ncbi:MAG: NAD(P)/FAD-dependent oxidoreductase [Thermomicrobiales bacterium]
MGEKIVIIGAGTAGLAVSHALRERGVDHQLLERRRIGETWRSERWDAFTMVTPSWITALPALPLDGHDPDGFLSLVEWLAYLDRYAAACSPPVWEGVAVSMLRARTGGGFLLETPDGMMEAGTVVVATGFFRMPLVPSYAIALPAPIRQLPGSMYRNPSSLPPGAVLVAGTGQTGSQIAEELLHAGREVYLSVGRVGRTPRRYRGKDSMWWRHQPGFPGANRDRPASYSHMTGKDGGRDLNLHQFARDGMHLLGRVEGISGQTLLLAGDLHQRLAEADAADQQFRRMADAFIASTGMEAPPDSDPSDPGLRDGFEQPTQTALDLETAGISTVIWATGFRPDFSWIDLPVLDDQGRLTATGSESPLPGLYFAGMRWERPGITTLIGGLGPEAEAIANRIAGDRRSAQS